MNPLPPPPSTEAEPVKTNRLADPASRNLLFAWCCAGAAVLLLAAAILLAGPGVSLVALLTIGVTMAVIWVVSRLGLPRQPRGNFLTAGIATLVGLLVPLTSGVFQTAHQPPAALLSSTAPGDSPSPSPSPFRLEELPALSEAFPVDRPNPETDSYVEIMRDSRIKVEDAYYRINHGETFTLRRVAGDEVVFKTRDFLISLPAAAVKIHRVNERVLGVADVGPASQPTPGQSGETRESPKTANKEPDKAASEEESRSALEITRTAQATAVERYPALSIKDSRENQAYVQSYMHLKQTNPDFFKDPEWPLQLAEALAERDGWKREDH